MSTTFTSDDDLLKHDTDGPNKKFRQAAKKVILANRFFSGRSSFRRVSVRDILQNTSLLAVDDTDDGDVTPTSIEPADNIDRAYDATTLKGKPDGLFRACMEAIRSLHHEARQIRTALILLGLFTDPELYKDWLAVFYIVNLELETKIKSKDFEESLGENENELSILNNLRKLGARYYFSELYEKDLQLLFGVSTRAKLLRKVESSLSNKPNAREYQIVVKTMTTASELAGAVFCLWGVFIVGGGAMARQRALKMCGEDAVNVYQNVSGPGREKRKRDFIEMWDALANNDTNQFAAVKDSSELCMKLMNSTIKDLSANPWWLKWATGSTLALVGGAIAVMYTYLFKEEHPMLS